mgnify:CR=1 FL=1
MTANLVTGRGRTSALRCCPTTPRGDGFRLLVHHTDAEREWAYDRNSHIGRLDKALDGNSFLSARADCARDEPKERMPILPLCRSGKNLSAFRSKAKTP